jgi:putative oxidoreductase
MRYVVLIGRILYAAIFILSATTHFSAATIGYASSQGVPFASVLVPIAGILALAGGLSILLGYKAKVGAWLIVIFLVPVTVMLHRFWGIADPMAAMGQQVHFMKNLSLLGAALMVAYFGAGPVSLDTRAATGGSERSAALG